MALGKLNLSLEKVALSVVLGLVLVQVVNWLLNVLFGVALLKLGNIILALIVLLTAAGAAFLIIIKKQLTLEKRDLFALILVVGIVGVMAFYLPKLVPAWFDNGGFANIKFAAMSIFG